MTELLMSQTLVDQMVGHCFSAYPFEGCGFLAAAPGTSTATKVIPVRNSAASSRIYTIEPKDLMNADIEADDSGLEIIAVFHSHTHTAAYPSPTDVAQAPVPDWHYVLVSFAEDNPEVHSYRILDGNISEEPLILVD